MARFLNNLKQKTIAGSSGPSSSELQAAGQTIFLERPNVKDLEELMMVQAAHQLQTQNNGLQWPGQSSIIETSIPDGQTETAVLIPSGFQIYRVRALMLKNATGGAAACAVSFNDGTTSVPMVQLGSISGGSTASVINPFVVATSSNGVGPLDIDSSLYITVTSDTALTAQMAVQLMSFK
jgi:hypothetical protein